MRLILASQSTNRKKLLEQIGLEFEVIVSEYEEDMTLDMTPAELVKHLAEGKARDIAEKHPEAVVIGADTVFVLDGKVGGKPAGNEEAVEMLTTLTKNPHQYISGVCIYQASTKKVVTFDATVNLRLRDDLTTEDLCNYIASEKEPVTTKAGAYDGANLGATLIAHVEGDLTTGFGLPVGMLSQELKAFGIDALNNK
jgi:septum formation protein